MSGRPEILFPLFAELKSLEGVGPKTALNYQQMHVETPRDLLFTLPHSGIDRRVRDTVDGVIGQQVVTVEVQIDGHQPPRQKGRPYRVFVSDAQISFQLVFFHAREDYVRRMLPEGGRRIVSGKVESFDNLIQMVHPNYMLPVSEAGDIPQFEPVYPLTAGVTQKGIYKAAQSALSRVPQVDEWVDGALLAREGWPAWEAALVHVHAPQNNGDLSPEHPARLRLAYDELMAHQLTLALARAKDRRAVGRASVGT